MGKCSYCNGNHKLKLHRAANIRAIQSYVVKCEDDTDGTIVIENTSGMPAYIDINYCPMCGKDLREGKHESTN